MYMQRSITPLLVACSIVSACTSENDRAADADRNSPAAAGSDAGTAGPRDACELLSAEEVAAAHGSPVEVRPREDEGQYRSSCVYGVPGSNFDVMWLTVHWRGGTEEWQTQQAGRGIAVDVMSGEADDGVTRPDPLAGIGDAAYYGGILPSLVLEGDVLLEFMMPLLRNDREHFPVFARKALSRL